jgi:WD40 repeat protein
LLLDEDRIWIAASKQIYGYEEATSEKPLQVLQGHLDDICAMVRIPETQQLVTSALDGVILLWGSNGGRQQPVEDRDNW